MNYTAVYFSPTGTSEKSAISITTALAKSPKYEQVNLTTYNSRTTKAVFSSDDFVIFGAPVYSGRIPEAAAQRFNQIQGQQTPCIVTVTYGNRDYDDALLELADLVEANGFVVKAAAALIGQHTFGEIQVGRPDSSDEKENQKFADSFLKTAAITSFTGSAQLSIKGNHPYRKGGKGGKFRPQTATICNKCGLCVRTCPMGAISSDCSTIDSQRCISCFSCIRRCPIQAHYIDDSDYLAFAEEFSKKLAARRENEYFLPGK